MGLRGRSSCPWAAEGPPCTRIEQKQHHGNDQKRLQQWRLPRLRSGLLLLLLVLADTFIVSAARLLPRLPRTQDTVTNLAASAGARLNKPSLTSWCGGCTGGKLQRGGVGSVPAGFLNSVYTGESCVRKAGCKRKDNGLRSSSSKGGTAGVDSSPKRMCSSASTSTASSKSVSNYHAFSSTVLLPRSSFRLRGATWKSELAVQRLWQRHDTYKQLLLQIWCMNKCLQHLKDHNSSANSSNRKKDGPTEEILDSLGFAVAPPSSSGGSCDGTMLLLDGPPYANGEPHMGHAVNKCVKDFAVRAALLQRRCCHMLPGWDCHGLPIELRAAAAAAPFTQQGASAQATEAGATAAKGAVQVTPNTGGITNIDCNGSSGITDRSDSCTGLRGRDGSKELRNAARQVALHFASVQQKAFQRFGVWAHWDAAYKTLDSDFKSHELHLFALLWNSGLVHPSRFPVYWSTTSLSTVPDSEVVLKPTPRDCLYFKLLLAGPPPVSDDLEAFSRVKGIPWFFLAWTTTPFTIPANRALAVSASTHYAVLRASLKGPQGEDEEIWVVGEKCVTRLLEALKGTGKPWDVQQIGTLSGSSLEGLRYTHPVARRVTCPILLDPAVENDKGTSILHVAPAHSQEDYRLCERASQGVGLLVQQSTDSTTQVHVPLLPALGDEAAATAVGAPVLCPVGPLGTFLRGSGSEPFKGLEALKDGEQCIIEYLRSNKTLLLTQRVVLPFPHDERGGCPLLLRATPQLHFNVQSLLPEIFQDLQRIRWLPRRRSPKQQQNYNSGSAAEHQMSTQAQEEECKIATPAAAQVANTSPGYERMRAALQTRPPTWCLSRQRQWGLPIPLVEQHEVDKGIPHYGGVQTPGHMEEGGRWANLRLDSDLRLYSEPCEEATEGTEGLLSKLRKRRWCEVTFDVWFDAASAWLIGHTFVQKWARDANSFLSKYLPQLQQQRRQPRATHHQHERPLHGHQQGGWQSSQKSKELLPEGETEGYSCLVVEGSDQSRGWFQSLLLSHAGARESLRRQRARHLRPGALQPEDHKGKPGLTMQSIEIGRAASGAETSLREKPKPETAALNDSRLPQLPFNVVVTHGFVVDSSGNKLSKSKGNALSPDLFFSAERDAAAACGRKPSNADSGSSTQPQQQHRVRKQRKDGQLAYGADVLRLFVGALDFGGDMACPSADSENQQHDRHTVMHAASATYVKLRNAFKYLIGSLHDFDISTDVVPVNKLPLFDIGMMLRLQALADDVGKAYEVFQHNKALRLLLRFISEDLSATFIEVAKDRLYLDHPKGYRRRSCQTVLAVVLLVLTQLVSPLTPHMAEEVFFRMPGTLRKALASHRRRKILEALGSAGEEFANVLGLCGPLTSVFQVGWPRMHLPIEPATATEAEQLWDLVLLLRQDVHGLFTRARQLQNCSNVGVPRVGSLNDLKLSITTPTKTMFDKLQSLVPQSNLLKPAPLSRAFAGRSGTAEEMRPYVDDLRWLVQCSDIEVHTLMGSGTISNAHHVEGEALLASVEEGDSHSGLNMKMYMAQGPKCQRCWMRVVTSTRDIAETQGRVDYSQHADQDASPVTYASTEATHEAPFACERCTDVMRSMQNKA